MQTNKNIVLTGSGKRPVLLDIIFNPGMQKRPVIIYSHGFNGFKDWGNFDLVAYQFVKAGYVFVKFNFSHNGTTPDQPTDFADLEAFGNNNYTKELEDIRMVTDWVSDPLNDLQLMIDSSKVYLLGHSMGGGISILAAAEDTRISKLITWASISECTTPWGNWPVDRMLQWKEEGVQFYINTRTGQQMPLYYQLYEDYYAHRERLDICRAIRQLTIPVMICHGTLDSAVPVEKAYQLKQWQPAAQLFIIESDHVFGRKHPWTEKELPPATEAVITAGLQFLK